MPSKQTKTSTRRISSCDYPVSRSSALAVCALFLTTGKPIAAQDFGGSTYPGPYYMGSPDAPVTFEEYADFQ